MTGCDCGVNHVPIPDGIEVRDQDDEIVAHGAFVHLERLGAGLVFLSITTPNGRNITVDLYAPRGRGLSMLVEGDVEDAA